MMQTVKKQKEVASSKRQPLIFYESEINIEFDLRYSIGSFLFSTFLPVDCFLGMNNKYQPFIRQYLFNVVILTLKQMNVNRLFRQTFLIMLTVSFISLTANCQNRKNPYQGLKNRNMVNTLQNFPRKPARWNVPAEDGRLLHDIIKKNGYKRILEIGTSNGYSALWMGYALKETGGSMITIEINRERASEARKNIREAGLSSLIDVRLNDALNEIPNLSGNFDFVFLDADKSEYIKYYKLLKPAVESWRFYFRP